MLELTSITLQSIAEQATTGIHLATGSQHLMLTRTIIHPEGEPQLDWRLTLFTEDCHHIGHLFFRTKTEALQQILDACGKILVNEHHFNYTYPVSIIEIV